LQLGVAVKGGVETIVHSAQITFARCQQLPKHGMLQVDFRNAFNSITRSKVIDEIRRVLPGLSAFTTGQCYSNHSHLLWGDRLLSSEDGVQQGDPLGPLLFAIALLPLVLKIQEEVPGLLQNSWYLDDGLLGGPEEQLAKALDIILTESPSIGLSIRLDKCELWCTEDLPSINTDIPRNFTDGLEVLGAPIGSPTLAAAAFARRVDISAVLLSRLDSLDDSQCSLGILRSCVGSPKLSYSLRTSAPDPAITPMLARFDAMQRDALELIVGVPMCDISWDQATLPVKLGGIGIRRASDQHVPAFVGSLYLTRELTSDITGLDPLSAVPGAASALRAVEETGSPSSGRSQSTIQATLDKAANVSLLERCTTTRDKARMKSLSLPMAGASYSLSWSSPSAS
jgi:hypothetical protein